MVVAKYIINRTNSFEEFYYGFRPSFFYLVKMKIYEEEYHIVHTFICKNTVIVWVILKKIACHLLTKLIQVTILLLKNK